tara:strand:- start:85 stop:699 length:615 start_codon:yes stop_codon:yes gene_type:complete
MGKLLELAASKEGIVLDIGANGGCEMSSALRSGRRVVGVECLASAYEELLSAEHISANPNATLLHVCAGSRIQMGELYLARDSSSLIEFNVAKGLELRKVPKTGSRRESVVIVPVDSLLSPNERVAVIKVDVQGVEYDVLKGLMQTVARDLPVIGYEDSNVFRKSGEVRDLLAPLGYACHQRWGDRVCSPNAVANTSSSAKTPR